MKVKELMALLQCVNPELLVVGYCKRSEDDFFVTGIHLDRSNGVGLNCLYNQGHSCMDGQPPQDVAIIC